MTDTLTIPGDGRIFLGDWAPGAGPTHTVVEPATGSMLGTVHTADGSDVDRAVKIGTRAQAGWAATPFDRRAEILHEAARLLRERTGIINAWNIGECGSIPPKAEWELNASYEQAQMAAAMPAQPIGHIYPSSIPGRRNYWRRVPLGVVGVIAPWNFPILLALRSVLPALAMGNAVILKPDLRAAVCGGLLLAHVFKDAGAPDGVFHVLPGGADTGEALVRHPGVDMISFTGSTAVGRRIGEICGGMLKKVSLELGGNNPLVVLEDADLDGAASCGAWGSFLHQGQICMQTGRHLAHRSIADAYGEKLAERARRLIVGNPGAGPVHLGPLIDETQARKVEEIVGSSVAMGARVLAGGHRNGRFFEPTVLSGVTPDMPAFREEIFGPVAPITVFDDDDEALALIRRSDYGLAAAVHGRSIARALDLARRIPAGMVHVNDQTVNNEFQVPFGGMGISGNGSRFGGPPNLDVFSTSQWISVIDTPLEYPF